MLFDLNQIGVFIFIFAVFGYIAKYYSDLAIMRQLSYLPKRTGELDKVLHYSTSGLYIVLVLSWFIIILYYEGMLGNLFEPMSSTFTLLQTNQLITEDEQKYLLKSFVFFISFIFYGFLLLSSLICISILWGLITRYFSEIGFMIKLKNKTMIDGRFIYDMQEFLSFVDVEGNWKAIKKENIESIEKKEHPPLFTIGIKRLLRKKPSTKDLLLLAKSIGISFIVTFFIYTAVSSIDRFSIILFVIGLILLIMEKYFNKYDIDKTLE